MKNAISTIDITFQRAEILARAAGLSDFRVGKQDLLHAETQKTELVHVSNIWIGSVMPPFSEHFSICYVGIQTAPSAQYEDNDEQAIVITATHDPLKANYKNSTIQYKKDAHHEINELLEQLPWSNVRWHMPLDGVYYSVLFQTMNMCSGVIFSNPEDPHLRSIEYFLKKHMMAYGKSSVVLD